MIQDYFDKIICINLAKRPDRWKQVTQEFAKAGITNVQRYYAIDGNPMGWKYVPDGKTLNQIKPQSWDGAAGCMASHVNIWKLAKENNWKNVLIGIFYILVEFMKLVKVYLFLNMLHLMY